MELVGRTVKKEFKGFGVFSGIVESYDSSTGFFEIVYEDGDSEDLEFSEIASVLVGDQPISADLTNKKNHPLGVGRKPKKRRRFEIPPDSGDVPVPVPVNRLSNSCSDEIQGKDGVGPEGFAKTLGEELGVGENCNNKDTNFSNRNVDVNASCDGVDSNHRLDLNDELNLNDGVNLNHGLDLNVGSGIDYDLIESENMRRSNFIDLNLDLNEGDPWSPKWDEAGDSVAVTWKRERCFDLNLGLEDETKNSGAVCDDGHLTENTSAPMAEEILMTGSGGDVEGMRMECGSVNGDVKGIHLETVEGTVANGFSGSTENLVANVIQKGDEVSPGSLKRDATFGVLNTNFSIDRSSSEMQLKGLSDACNTALHEYQGNSGSAFKGRSSRKRRKVSDSGNSTTETVLRRSTRRGRTSAQNAVSSGIGLNAVNDAVSSPAVSAVSEEKPTVSGHEECEEHDIVPPRLQLPPSSGNLNLDGIPVLDLFSVYAFLRSFSALLFLSPFELEDFVVALRCKAPNFLFDSIHVSLLQTLRKHLDFLSVESFQSASNCLRSLNWDLLDLITWPMFMVEYLLIHSSGLKNGFDLCRLKLFENDYYKQPISVMIEILRCLCDDVIEVEAIRSELNRRTLATEHNADFDWNMKFETSKKRRTGLDVSGGSCLTEEVVEETADWNSDECRLCKMDGSLICCDGCPAAFHSRCVGIASILLPEGDWFCPECVIDKDKPWMRVGKSIRGAELLGTDLYGRLYYSSCGYLLVSDSCDTDCSFNYYYRNDLTAVIEALKSSHFLYSTILSAITKHWNVSTVVNGAKCDMDSGNVALCLDFLVKGEAPATPMPPLLFIPSETCVKDESVDERKLEEKSMISTYSGNVGCEVSELVNINPAIVDHSMKIENPLASSEGSAEISQVITGNRNFHRTGLDCLNRSAGMSKDSELSGKPVSVGDGSLASTNLEVEQGKNIQSADRGCTLSTLSTKEDTSQGQCGTSYVNYYSFARTASSVAEELAHKSSGKISEDSTRTVEEVISTQLKAISNKSTGFHWSNIQNLNVDARKEKCGWCFSCKVPYDDRDCLFIMNDTGPVLENFTSELLGIRARKNRRGHLIDVMCHILFIEDRLHGLLLGPWLNPHYSKVWRKNVLRASDITSVKHLLLTLESNLRRLALSSEWLKHVDSVATMGSASHVAISTLRVSSKHGIARKRARCLDLEPNASSNAATGLGLFWWRGGKLSRQLFKWKVLPLSLASKAARQAGHMKIPGILYPESSEFAKRSKFVAWRASVETSRSVEQLALQVRDFDANIRWDDIENTNLLSKMGKESKKSMRSFKKVIIRRKCSEGIVVKYLLDFGKRRFIPDVVARHGSLLEESSSGRKKYWLEESYVPLHLLKVFEERRISRKSSKTISVKLHESRRIMKNPSKKRGFSYLFSKAERSENYQCGHCYKDVLIREAVSCQYCEGFFHKRHVRKSAGAIAAECTYTCHKCQDGKHVKIDTKKGKPELQTSKKASKVSRLVSSKISRKSGKDKQPAQLQKNKKVSVVVPLRRSPRKVKSVLLQSKKITGHRKGKQPKSRKGTSRKGTLKKPKRCTWQKKRTLVYHSYWLNGLLLSRKPNDERVLQFSSKKLLATSPQLTIHDQPKCSLCSEAECTSPLNYIGCEICGDWFHGDAFGLRAENIGNLIGFKCHKCRNRSPPLCPHLRTTISDEAQLGVVENDVAMECAEEISNDLALPNEMYVKQESRSEKELKGLFFTDESNLKDQQAGTIPDCNQTPTLDAENGLLPTSLGPGTESLHNSNEEVGGPPDTLMESNDSTTLQDNSIQLGDGHVVIVTALAETESPLTKSDADVMQHQEIEMEEETKKTLHDPPHEYVASKELKSLGHNHVKNGLMKTTILGSVVNKTLVDSSELPPHALVASGELIDRNDVVD